MNKVLGVALLGSLVSLILKKHSSEYVIVIQLAAVIFCCFLIYPSMLDIIDIVREYGQDSGISSDYLKIIIKSFGIAVITKFASDICKDNDQNALAANVEFSGKIMMISASLPIIKSLIEVTVQMIDSG